jgi:thiamine-phosphate pyrophosphorylase
MSDSRARARLARAAKTLAGRSALPALVLMTDDRLEDALAAAHALPRGSLVIARDRDRATLAALSANLLKIARRRGFAVSVADARLAATLGADGIHLPEAWTGKIAALRARHPGLLITTAAHSLRALLRAQQLGADAVLLSPVFATASHPERTALGPMRANAMARMTRVPVYALGGIDAQNVPRLSGFAGIAAVGGLSV